MTNKRLSNHVQNLEDILERSRSTANYRPLDLADIGPTGPVEEASGRGAARMMRDYASPAVQRVPQRLYADVAAEIDNDVQELKADLRIVTNTLFDFVSKSEENGAAKVKKFLADAKHSLRQLESAIEAFKDAQEDAESDPEGTDPEALQDDLHHYGTKAAAKVKHFKTAIGKAVAATEGDDEAGKEFDREIEALRRKFKELKARMKGDDPESEAREKEEQDRREAEAEAEKANARKSYRAPKAKGLSDFSLSPPTTNVTNILSRAGAFGRRNSAPPTGAQAAVAKAGNSLSAIKERILGSSCTMESSLRAQRIAQLLENGSNAEASELLKSSTADVKNLFH